MKKYYEDYEDKDPDILVVVEGCLCISFVSHAFVPLESLVLGDLSQILLRENPTRFTTFCG